MRRRISGSNTQPPSRVYTYPYAQPPTLVDPVSGRRFPFCPQINDTEETAQRCGLYSTNDLAARIDRSIDRWTNRKSYPVGGVWKKKINAAPMTSDIRFRARKKRASFSADRLYTLALLSIPRVCNLLGAPCSLLSLPTRSFTPVLFRPSFSLLSLFHHFLLRVRYVDRLSKTAVQRFITLYFYRGHFRLCAGGIGGKVKHFASIKGEICGMNDI